MDSSSESNKSDESGELLQLPVKLRGMRTIKPQKVRPPSIVFNDKINMQLDDQAHSEEDDATDSSRRKSSSSYDITMSESTEQSSSFNPSASDPNIPSAPPLPAESEAPIASTDKKKKSQATDKMQRKKSLSRLDKRISKGLVGKKLVTQSKKYAKAFFQDYEGIVESEDICNDPERVLLVVPKDDISIIQEDKEFLDDETIDVPEKDNPWLLECFHIFTKKKWNVVRYNNADQGASLPPKISQDTLEQSLSSSAVNKGRKSKRKTASFSQNPFEQELNAGFLAAEKQQRMEYKRPLFSFYNAKAKTLGVQEMMDFSRSKIHQPFEFLSFPKKTQILLECKELCLAEPVGELDFHTPVFCTISVHDFASRTKLSEDFHFELNSEELRKMLDRKEKSADAETLIHRAILSITGEPHANIYVILRINKILLPEEKEKALFGLITKKKKHVSVNDDNQVTLTSTYREPYCWAVLQLFNPEFPISAPFPGSINNFIPVKMATTDEEIYDLIMSEKDMKKSKTIPGHLSINMTRLEFNTTEYNEIQPIQLNPRLEPIGRSTFEPSCLKKSKGVRAVKNIQEFSTCRDFLINYVNTLYIYPKRFMYKDKSTIYVEIQVKASEAGEPIQCIFGSTYTKKKITTYTTMASFNSKQADFVDEIKIDLPSVLTPQHHILFTIYDLDLKKLKPQVIGYSFLPLFNSNGQFGFDLNLPVCEELSENYLDTITHSKMKWLDNKKKIFNLRATLESSIYSLDPHINSLFSFFKRSTAKGDATYETLNATLPDLPRVDKGVLFRHFPIIFNLLINLLCSGDDAIAKEAFLALIQLVKIVNTATPGKHSLYLRTYIMYMFDNEYFEDKCPDSATSTPVMLPFDAICKYYLAALNSQSAAIVSFDINWFLFGLINKSMIQYLASNNLLKESRRSRFSEDFIIRLQKLMRTILCDRHRRGGIDYTMASALFLKDLCSIMDRGVVFTMILEYLESGRGEKEVPLLDTFKFSFIKLLSNYEHYLPLNLPLRVKTSQLSANGIPSFVQTLKDKHIIVGQIMEEVERLYRPGLDIVVRNQVVVCLRSSLHKHELDPRYSDPKTQRRIADIYFPLIITMSDDTHLLHDMPKQEREEWLICFLYVARNCNPKLLMQWWGLDSQTRKINFVTILSIAFKTFDRGSLAKQTCVTVLDILSELLAQFPAEICALVDRETQTPVALKKVVTLMHELLETRADEVMIQFFIGPMQQLIEHCTPTMLNSHEILPILVLDFLHQCNHPLIGIQMFGSQMLYLLARKVYQSQNNFARIKVEATVAISKLVGTTNLVKKDFSTLLLSISNMVRHASDFPYGKEFEETMKHVTNLLEYSSRIEENNKDPQMMQELYLNISYSFLTNPEIRVAWIDNLTQLHMKNEDFEEAGQCRMLVANLILQFLMRDATMAKKIRTRLEPDFHLFATIAPNVGKEPGITQSSTSFESAWNFKYLIDNLKQAVVFFEKATRYELAMEVHTRINALYKMDRRYEDLGNGLRDYKDLCDRLGDVNNIPDRVYPIYFRVVFYGSKFGDLDGKQYIYKKSTKWNLPTFKKQIESQYAHLGAELVVLSTNDNIKKETLDPAKIYVQMTGVTPYIEDDDLDFKISKFDQSFKQNRFLFEMPFTDEGSAHTEDLSKQKKKKNIYITQDFFPTNKTRLPIVDQSEIILDPLENAIELIAQQEAKIRAEISNYPTRIVTLQQVIQGSVVPMVNPGPVKICDLFFNKAAVAQFPRHNLEKLIKVMSSFVRICGFAIKLNNSLSDDSHLGFKKMVVDSYTALEQTVKNAVANLQLAFGR